MNIRIQYFLLVLGLIISSFTVYFLLYDNIIYALEWTVGITGIFLLYFYGMVKMGRWKW